MEHSLTSLDCKLEDKITLLITGGAGFIASHIIEGILITTSWNIVVVDKLSYASKGWNRLKDSGVYYDRRVLCLTWDLETPFSEGMKIEIGEIDIIIHMAAETHVDDSISRPIPVIRNNVMSTVNILEYAREIKSLKCFLQFSTDEVYGVAGMNCAYKEWDRHNPTNPYSASKSAAEQFCLAYQNTYKIPLIITNLMNVFGERQHSQKFLPLLIKKLLKGESVDIHTGPDGVTPGSRFYIHARNVFQAILFILQKGSVGEKYNIRGEREVDNLELAHKVSLIVGKPLKYELVRETIGRPGHDIRYALDGSKLHDLGWSPLMNFDHSLEETVKWTLQHPEWLES